MYAVLTSVSVSKAGLMAYLFQRKLEVQVGDVKLQLPAATAPLFFSFTCSKRFTVFVSMGGRTIPRSMRFTVKEATLPFTFENVSVELSFNLVREAWTALDPTIKGCGEYAGRRYYVESGTLETSYENVFRESKLFPSFQKLVIGQQTVYADAINKIVIRSNPTARRAHVLGKLRLFLSTAAPRRVYIPQKITISRDSLLGSAWSEYIPAFATRGFYEILISFADEIGEDQGGLKREFLYLLFNELIRDERIDKGAAVYDVDPTSPCPDFIYLYTSRKEQISVLEDILRTEATAASSYYIVLGAVIASLFLLSEALQFNFSLMFYENILHRNFTLRHVQDIELQRNLHASMSSAEASEYVHERLVEPKKNHYDHIRFGFDLVLDSVNPEGGMSKRLAETFTAFDFPFLFYHFEPVNTEKLRSVVEYVNCNSSTREIQWLWQVLDSKDQMFISKFLQFITGSGNLPSLANGRVFTIEKRSGKNELFRSSACIKRLYMCSFESLECLKESLDASVMNSEGFHFV